MTLRHPPSKGESTVAANIEPSMNPAAMPMEAEPLARPKWRPENQMPQVLCTLVGIDERAKPAMKTVTESVTKSNAKPRSAPVTPARKQAIIRARLAPMRSPMMPPTKAMTMPIIELRPQTVPICTRFKFRSVDISLKSTGSDMFGMPMTSVWVRVARIRTYHL